MTVELPEEMQTLKETLTERFVSGIRKSFSPCPLIGPNWLQGFPKGKPADFRFFGVRKLAKALGLPTTEIVKILLKNVSFDGLEVDVVSGEDVIDMNRTGKKSPEKVQPAKPSSPKPQHSHEKKRTHKPQT